MTKTLSFALIAGALLLSACAAPRRRLAPAEPYEPEIRQFVDDMVTDYVADNRESFFSRFDEKTFPDFSGFKEQVRLHLVQRRLHMLDFVPDHIRRNGDEATVLSHWRRTYDNYDGQVVEDHGTCTLLLEAPPSGMFYVKDIQGDSPF